MSKRVLREITKLNKVEEISVCTKENPPANRLREFEIMKDSLSKSEFEDLYEELSMPEYGEFTSYLNAWLEEDVNQVAYRAFIDALLASLKDVCFDNEMSKEEKASKMKENFDTFVSEYNNSVITKTEEGKIILNIEKKSEESINKQEKKVNILEEIKKFINSLESQEVVEEKVEKPKEEPVLEQEEPQTEAITEPEVVEEAKPEDAPVEEVAEEPIIEEQPEQVEEVVAEEVSEEPVEEIQEPVEKSEIVEEVSEEISKAQETISSLEQKIQELTKAQEESAVVIEKAELAKSVQENYSGLTGTQEEIIEHIYSINKSELSLETKDMILNSLKSLSKSNLELTKAIGVETPEEVIKSEDEIRKSKVEELMKSEGLSENKAVAVASGRMTLKQAKGKCKK